MDVIVFESLNDAYSRVVDRLQLFSSFNDVIQLPLPFVEHGEMLSNHFDLSADFLDGCFVQFVGNRRNRLPLHQSHGKELK
jgi:hypothetical protein